MAARLGQIALFLVAGMAWAAPSSPQVYRNEAMRIRSFEPPPSWRVSPQPSYPRLLVEYTHSDGGRLTVATQKVAPATSSETLAKGARPGLEKQGFSGIKLSADGTRTRLEARVDGGRRFLRQLYVVDGGLAYVVSMVASTVNEPQMVRDFDTAARSLTIGAIGTSGEARPSTEPDAGVAP